MTCLRSTSAPLSPFSTLHLSFIPFRSICQILFFLVLTSFPPHCALYFSFYSSKPLFCLFAFHALFQSNYCFSIIACKKAGKRHTMSRKTNVIKHVLLQFPMLIFLDPFVKRKKNYFRNNIVFMTLGVFVPQSIIFILFRKSSYFCWLVSWRHSILKWWEILAIITCRILYF